MNIAEHNFLEIKENEKDTDNYKNISKHVCTLYYYYMYLINKYMSYMYNF